MRFIISFFENTFLQLLEMGEKVINILAKSIYDTLYRIMPSWLLSALPDGAVEFLQSYSLIGLMFGAGILVYIGFIIAKFIIR